VLEVLDLSVTVLEQSNQFVVLADKPLLAFVHDLEFLVVGLGHALGFLHLLVPGLVSKLPQLLLESQLVGDEDVVEFLVFESQFLNRYIYTFLPFSAILTLSYRFFILR
jgi:hypothetical protein